MSDWDAGQIALGVTELSKLEGIAIVRETPEGPSGS